MGQHFGAAEQQRIGVESQQLIGAMTSGDQRTTQSLLQQDYMAAMQAHGGNQTVALAEMRQLVNSVESAQRQQYQQTGRANNVQLHETQERGPDGRLVFDQLGRAVFDIHVDTWDGRRGQFLPGQNLFPLTADASVAPPGAIPQPGMIPPPAESPVAQIPQPQMALEPYPTAFVPQPAFNLGFSFGHGGLWNRDFRAQHHAGYHPWHYGGGPGSYRGYVGVPMYAGGYGVPCYGPAMAFSFVAGGPGASIGFSFRV